MTVALAILLAIGLVLWGLANEFEWSKKPAAACFLLALAITTIVLIAGN